MTSERKHVAGSVDVFLDDARALFGVDGALIEVFVFVVVLAHRVLCSIAPLFEENVCMDGGCAR